MAGNEHGLARASRRGICAPSISGAFVSAVAARLVEKLTGRLFVRQAL